MKAGIIMSEALLIVLKRGLIPLFLLWLVFPIANIIIIPKAQQVWGTAEGNPFTKNLVDEADNTIWYGTIYLILLFLGQTLVPSGLVKTAFVVLTGILSVLCVISCVAKFVMSILELKYHLPGLRFCSTIELVAFLINAAVWAWLTFSMAQIFGLVR